MYEGCAWEVNLVILLSSCFRGGLGWGGGTEVLLEKVQLNFSFRNKFIIVLLRDLLVDSNTFSKTCDFKSLTDYT